ncbi:hypothetical protein Vafri_16748 [Volvox africanus]|uniref:Uncharacterized protein n=1 Tax=Volvox africanus TaxID=51714 RepID=A0A8J4BIX6_9CHLO|nr:hypothetical protein Vafri_16748 [Volvox africanus]
MPPVEGDSACLLLGVALCASQQHGGLPILAYPKDSPLLIDWDCTCQAASSAADATSVGVLQLQSCVLAYQSSHHGYVVLLIGIPSCPHSILRIKTAELLNLTDLLLGETLGRTLSAAPTRALLQLQLPKQADLLEMLLHQTVGKDAVDSATSLQIAFSTSTVLSAPSGVVNAPVPPGTLEALLERRLHAFSVLPLPVPPLGSSPAAPCRTFLPGPIAAAFQELRSCVPHRIGSHHVDLTAALPQHAARLATADMTGGRETKAGIGMITCMDSVVFSDLAELDEHGHVYGNAETTPASEGQQEGRHVGRGMRAMREMLKPPDSQLWALILSELHALDVVNKPVNALIQHSNSGATSSGGLGSQRQLCSIDLSALHPGLTASVVVLHLGARLPGELQAAPSAGNTLTTYPYSGGSGSGMHSNYSGGGRTPVAASDAVSHGLAPVARRHCLVAIVVVYILMDHDKASWELWSGDGAGGGVAATAAAVAATRMREASFRSLPYNIAIGPLGAPPVVRAVLTAAARKYEQAFPSTAAEVWRELHMVASEQQRVASQLELVEQPAARVATSRPHLRRSTSIGHQAAELEEPTLTPISAMSDSPEKLCSPSSQMMLENREAGPQAKSSALGPSLAPAQMGDSKATDRTAICGNAAASTATTGQGTVKTQKLAANQSAPIQGSAAAPRGPSVFATRASPPDWMLGSLSSSSSSSTASPISRLNSGSSIRPAHTSSPPAAGAYPSAQHIPPTPAPEQPNKTLTAAASVAAPQPVNQSAELPGWPPTQVSARKSVSLPSLSQPPTSTDSSNLSLPGLEETPVASPAGAVASGASEPSGGSFRPAPDGSKPDRQPPRDSFVPSPFLGVANARERRVAAGSHDDDDAVLVVSPDDGAPVAAATSADGPFARALEPAQAAAAGNLEESVSRISRFGFGNGIAGDIKALALPPVPPPALSAVALNLSPTPVMAVALGEGRELAAADIGDVIGGQEVPVSTNTRPGTLRPTGGSSPVLRVSIARNGADAVAAAVAAVSEAAGGLGKSQGVADGGGGAAAVAVAGSSPLAVMGSRSQHGSESANRDGSAHAGGMVAAAPGAISASSTFVEAPKSTGIIVETATAAITGEQSGNSRHTDMGSSVGPWTLRRASVPLLRLSETALSGGNVGAIDECPTPSLIHFSSLSSLSRFKQSGNSGLGTSETDAETQNTGVSALRSQLRQGFPAADPRAAIRITEPPLGPQFRSTQPGSPGASGPTANRQQATGEQLPLLPEPTVSSHLSAAASNGHSVGGGGDAASTAPPHRSISSSDEGSAAATSGGGSLGAASLRGSTHSLVSILSEVERQSMQPAPSPEAAAVTAVRENPDCGSSLPHACEGDARVPPVAGRGSFDAVVTRAVPAPSSPSGMVQVPCLPLQELQQQSLGGIVTSPRIAGPKAAGRYAAVTCNSPPGAPATAAAAQQQHNRIASAAAAAMPGSLRIPQPEGPLAASLSLLQLQELQQLRQLDQMQQLQQLPQPPRQLVLPGPLQQQQQQQLLVQLLQASGEIQAVALLLLQQQLQQQRQFPQRLQVQELPQPAQQLPSGLQPGQQLHHHQYHRQEILSQTQQLCQGPQLMQQQQPPAPQTAADPFLRQLPVPQTATISLIVGTDQTTSRPPSSSQPPPGDAVSTDFIRATTTSAHDNRMEASIDGWAREAFPTQPHVQSQPYESRPEGGPGQARTAMVPGRRAASVDPEPSNVTFRPHSPAASAMAVRTTPPSSAVPGQGTGGAGRARVRGNGARRTGGLELAGRPQLRGDKADGWSHGSSPQRGKCYRRGVCRSTPPRHPISSSSSSSGSSPSSPTLRSSPSLQSLSLGTASETVSGSGASRDGFPGFHRHKEGDQHRQSRRSRSRSRRSHSHSCKRRYRGRRRSQSPRMGRLGQSWDALRPPLPPPPGWMSAAPHLVGGSRLDRKQGQHKRAGVAPKDAKDGSSPAAIIGPGNNANAAGPKGWRWFQAPGARAQMGKLGYTMPHPATDTTSGRRSAPNQRGAPPAVDGDGVDVERNPSNLVQHGGTGTGIGAMVSCHGDGGNGGDLNAYGAAAPQGVSPQPPLSAILYPPPAIEAGAEALRHVLSDRQAGLPIAAYGLKLRDAVHLVVGSIVHSRHRSPVEIVAPPQPLPPQPASRVYAGSNPLFRGLPATTITTAATTAVSVMPVGNPRVAGISGSDIPQVRAAVAASTGLASTRYQGGSSKAATEIQASQYVTTSGANLGSFKDDAVNSKGSRTPPPLPSKCQPLPYVPDIGGDSNSSQPCMSGLDFFSVAAAAAAAATATAAVMAAASPRQSRIRPGVLTGQMEQLPGAAMGPLQQSPAWHGSAGGEAGLARSPSHLPIPKDLHRGLPGTTFTTDPMDSDTANLSLPSAAYIDRAGNSACQQDHQTRALPEQRPLQCRAISTPCMPSRHQPRCVPQPVVHRLVKMRMQQQAGHNHACITPQERHAPPVSPHDHHQWAPHQQRRRTMLASPRNRTAGILRRGENSTSVPPCSSACWVPERSEAHGQGLLGSAGLAAVELRQGTSAHVDIPNAVSNCPLSVNDGSIAAEDSLLLGSPHVNNLFNVRDRERGVLRHHQMPLLRPKAPPETERLPLMQQTKLSTAPPWQQQPPQQAQEQQQPESQKQPQQPQRQPLSPLSHAHIWKHKLPSTGPQPPTSLPPTDVQQQSLSGSLATGVIVPWVRILSRATRLTRARRAIALAAEAARFNAEDQQDAKDAVGLLTSSLPSPQSSIHLPGGSSDYNGWSVGEGDYCTIPKYPPTARLHLHKNGRGHRALDYSTGFTSTTSLLASADHFADNSSSHAISFESVASAVKAAEMVALGAVTDTVNTRSSSSRITSSQGNAGSVITLSPRTLQNSNAESQQSPDSTKARQEQQQRSTQKPPPALPLRQQLELWPSSSVSDACAIDAGARTATVDNLHIVFSPQQLRTSSGMDNLSRGERPAPESSILIAEQWPGISGTTPDPPSTGNVGLPGLVGPLAGSAFRYESGGDGGNGTAVQSPDTIDLLGFLRPPTLASEPAGEGGDGGTGTITAIDETVVLGEAHPPTAESWMFASQLGNNTARLFSIYNGRGWARGGGGDAAITRARYSPRCCSSSQAQTEGALYSSSSSMNFCTGAAGGPSFGSGGYNHGDYLSADFASSWSVNTRDRSETYGTVE